MKPTTPTVKVVDEALVLGVYSGPAAVDMRFILFLARSRHMSWTVGGRFPSAEDELIWRLAMPYETFRTVLRRLIRAGVITSQRLGNSYTYALSHQFLSRCRTLYEIRLDRAAVVRYHNNGGELSPSAVVNSHQDGGELSPPPYRALEEHAKSATADAGRPDGRPEEDTMSDTPNDGFYDSPKQPRGWGGKSEGTPLGGEQSAAPPKAVKHSPPRGKDVLAVKAYFQLKLLAFSEARHVPLWENVGKMHNNVQFLIRQEHSQDILERAIDFFASQAPSMMFQGTSLWDQFFAHREEALKFAAVAGIGTRGAPREDPMALSKRLSQHQREQRSK